MVRRELFRGCLRIMFRDGIKAIIVLWRTALMMGHCG